MVSRTTGRAGQLVGKLVFLVVGLALLVGASISAYRTQSFLRTCMTVQGRIAGFKPVHGVRRNRTTYAPVFRFNVPGTHFETVVSRTSSNPPAFKVGEWVTVRFPAGHPEKAVIDSFGQLWLMDWAIGSFGALFFTVGLLTLISGWIRNRRDLASPNADASVGILRRS
ncbi:MAG: DUF3592 domain-containing protein [Terracidiphilus sp.]